MSVSLTVSPGLVDKGPVPGANGMGCSPHSVCFMPTARLLTCIRPPGIANILLHVHARSCRATDNKCSSRAQRTDSQDTPALRLIPVHLVATRYR